MDEKLKELLELIRIEKCLIDLKYATSNLYDAIDDYVYEDEEEYDEYPESDESW